MAGLTSLWTLEGTWDLSRRIVHADGAEYDFTGQALFQRSGNRLLHDETGKMQAPGGGSMKATRRYVWQAGDTRLDVFFDDMRPFHSVPLGVAAPETTHVCPPDRYHVRYDFNGLPDWQAEWHVEGPRKAYVMRSRFTRAG